MDAYLDLAEDVLRRVRRPLSALQILRAAYQSDIAPSHLRGRTQHKTLGARLSEDILRLRDGSRFCRTAPGRFLLRDQLNDETIPEELRRPITARRRRRELARARSLAFDPDFFKFGKVGLPVVETSTVLKLIERGDFFYRSSDHRLSKSGMVVWAFVVVVKQNKILAYRQGHYREYRDTFVQRRTIGFYTPVSDEDLTLFERADHGIVSSGVRALATDLDLNAYHMGVTPIDCASLLNFIVADRDSPKDLLAIVTFSCPDWLDPTSKRLALNNLEWLDLSQLPNHREDFDPWSQLLLFEQRSKLLDVLSRG